MPNQSTPEINTLKLLTHHLNKHLIIPLNNTIQTIHNTKNHINTKIITNPFTNREDEIRREAVREIVEALRKQADQYHVDRAYEAAHVVRAMADRVERTFLHE